MLIRSVPINKVTNSLVNKIMFFEENRMLIVKIALDTPRIILINLSESVLIWIVIIR